MVNVCLLLLGLLGHQEIEGFDRHQLLEVLNFLLLRNFRGLLFVFGISLLPLVPIDVYNYFEGGNNLHIWDADVVKQFAFEKLLSRWSVVRIVLQHLHQQINQLAIRVWEFLSNRCLESCARIHFFLIGDCLVVRHEDEIIIRLKIGESLVNFENLVV